MPEPTVPPKGGLHRNNFDLLRYLLAAWVLISHAKVSHGASSAMPAAGADPHTLAMEFKGRGPMAVNCFFIISGYLITQSWIRKPVLADFTRKRLLRIYPGLFVALLISLFIFAPLGGAVSGFWHQWSSYSVLQPLWFQAPGRVEGVFSRTMKPGMVNGPVWTIRYELFCYLVVAVFGLAGLLQRRAVVLGAFVVSLAVFTAQVWDYLPLTGFWIYLPRFVTFFMAGAAYFLYQERFPHDRRWLVAAVVLYALSIKYAPTIGYSIFGTYILLYVAFSRTVLFPNFARHGDFSYGVYVFGWPMIMLMIQYLGAYLPPSEVKQQIILGIPGLLLTTLLAAASWHFVEKPCLRLAKREHVPDDKTTPPPPAPAAPPAGMPELSVS